MTATRTKLQTMRARTALLHRGLPGAPLAIARRYGQARYGGGAFARAFDRFLADPCGDDGDAFLELLEQLRYFVDHLRFKARSE